MIIVSNLLRCVDEPENIEITTKENSLLVQVNTTFTCSASGNPNASYTWIKKSGGGPEIINGPHLRTDELMAGENTYICNASNSVGSITESVSFSVGKQQLHYGLIARQF